MFKSSRNEIRELFRSRFMRLAIFVVGIIPLLYGVLYLWAFWDPYSRLKDLPVAVVNEDSGTITNSGAVNFGTDLVESLKSNQVLDWEFVSEGEAKSGLESTKYYAEIKIPSDFSTKIMSASTTDPVQANIVYIARESNSMIGTQLTNRIASQISENLSHEITENYLDSIFLQTRESAVSIQKAADGSSELSDGLTSALSGTSALSSGAASAYSGSSALVLAINQILLGDKDLNAGLSQTLTGAQTLNSGITSAASGASTLASGTKQLQSGISQVSTGTNQLISNVNSTTSNLTIALSYLNDPNTVISDSSSSFYGMTKLQAATYIISNIITTANSSANQDQITSLQSGLSQITSGSATVSSGADSLSSALNNDLGSGSNSLVTAINSLVTGSNTITSGLTSTLAGSKSLESGLAEIETGTKELDTGLASAKTGAETLGSQLSTGAEEALQNSDISLTEKIAPVIANPVMLNNESIDEVANYGTGFSPYFIPLALWVGSLVLFLVIKLNDRKTGTKPKQYFMSKFLTLAKIGTAQAVVLDLVLILALGLKVTNYLTFFLFTILLSWVFLAILEFLVASLQDGGKFLGIVLLMLQLTSASGTYPVQTSPAFFQKINPYLPMTYAVRGLREIISGGNTHNTIVATLILCAFLIGFLFITLLFSNRIAKSKLDLSV